MDLSDGTAPRADSGAGELNVSELANTVMTGNRADAYASGANCGHAASGASAGQGGARGDSDSCTKLISITSITHTRSKQ